MLFKNWKHVFELWYQTGPNIHTFMPIKNNCVLIITVYVCAKAKECVLVRASTSVLLKSCKTQFLHILPKKCSTSILLKLCKNMYIFTRATVTV